jgi:hypothetical protein
LAVVILVLVFGEEVALAGEEGHHYLSFMFHRYGSRKTGSTG